MDHDRNDGTSYREAGPRASGVLTGPAGSGRLAGGINGLQSRVCRRPPGRGRSCDVPICIDAFSAPHAPHGTIPGRFPMRRVPAFALLFCFDRAWLSRGASRPSAGLLPKLLTSGFFCIGSPCGHARAREPMAVPAVSANRDAGNIAIIEDTDGVVARQNEFNLDLKTLRFTPAGVRLRVCGPRWRVRRGRRVRRALRWPRSMTTTAGSSRCPSHFRSSAPAIARCTSTPTATSRSPRPTTPAPDRSLGRMTARAAAHLAALRRPRSRRRPPAACASSASRRASSSVGSPSRVGRLRHRRAADVSGEALPGRPHRVRLQRRRAVERAWWESRRAACKGATALVDFRNDASASILRARSRSASATRSISTSSPSRSASTRRTRTPTTTSSSTTTWTSPRCPAASSRTRAPCAAAAPATACRRATMARSTGRASRLQAVLNMGPLSAISGGPERARAGARAGRRHAGDHARARDRPSVSRLRQRRRSERSHGAPDARIPESALELSSSTPRRRCSKASASWIAARPHRRASSPPTRCRDTRRSINT